jgi:hypothetical protein
MHSNYYKDCRCNTTIDHLCCTTVLTCNQTVPAPDVTTVTATDACGTPTVTFVSDVTILLAVQKQQPELTVLLILAAILLNALKLLQGL